ncbi:histone H1-I [Drosophila santomea]|uniref:histone H1-I n=1 Tax=Drosophila santomea TaxID=129105 RepID=UPI001954B709|nr:histone H1-I [Drosophila santomea]
MKLKLLNTDYSSDDESEEEMPNDNPAPEESDMGEEEELTEEDEEMEEREDQSEGDEPEVNNPGADRHPYPTPPPDAGSKMVPADPENPKSMVLKPKGSLISLALMAIGKLASRSGSSVQAIMTYLKDNGQEWKDPKKTARLMHRALKLAESNGEVVMVKRSFKLTDKQKSSSKAVEKMKAKKQKEKEKKAKAEQIQKEKIQKKEAKEKMKEKKKAAKEKPSKPTERKTKQAGKKKKTDDASKNKPPSSKAASSAAAQAMLETSQIPNTEAEKKAAKPKIKAEPTEAGKAKKPRKSIGTLAQPKTPRPKVKAVKKLVAGKGVTSAPELSDMEAQATSTPQMATKGKRKRKV